MFVVSIGCARFAYDYMLRLRTDAWYQEQKRLSEVSSVPVQQALRHLQTAFTNFFAKRASTQPSTHGVEHNLNPEKRELTMAKMTEPLNVRWSRTIPKKAKVTISRDTAGRYFASLLCDDSVDVLPPTGKQIGIDMNIEHFPVTLLILFCMESITDSSVWVE